MTAATGHSTEVPRPDTHEMVIIHRAFRRETRLLAALIAEVPAGDTARARVLAAHFRWYQLGVHNHHTGEDELIWPLLLARVDLEADVVVRMEAQHERVAQTLARAPAALQEWESSAAPSARDDLVAALTDHRAVLVEHLDDEEAHLLPLAARYLTVAEWGAMGEHFLAHTPRRHLLVSLGAVLRRRPCRAGGAAGALPRPARLVWHTAAAPSMRDGCGRFAAGARPAAAALPRTELRQGGNAMTLTHLGYGLSWVICLGIIVVGARFLLAPRPSAAGFGVDVGPEAGQARAYLAVKAVRDIGAGLVAFVLIVAASRQALGLFMLAAAIIPIGDALIVLRYNGPRILAYAMHGGTALVMLVIAALLLR